MGFHWKSSATLGRLPLVHVAIGLNEEGVKETAFGVIAVGKRAIGVVAIGQFGIGVIAIAQFGFGLVAGLGQAILAPIALAQGAVAVIALAQLALGAFVIGQISVGYMGVGQSGWRTVDYDWLQWFGADAHVLATFVQSHIATIPLVIVGAIFALVVVPHLLPMLLRAIHEQIVDLRVRFGLVQIEEAKAKILEVRDIGMYVNNVPINEMLIEYVTRSGQRIKTKLRARHNRFAHLKVGSKISIAYDQARPARAFLPRNDWR